MNKMRFKWTDAEITKALNKLVIVIDGREQRANPYRKWFDVNGVEYIDNIKAKIKKAEGYFALETGDYSCMLPKGSIPGIDKDIWFDRDIIVEKKGSIKELAGNLSKDKGARLKKEFSHINKYGTKVYIFMADALYYKHLSEGKEQHIGLWNKDTLRAQINSLEAMYGTSVIPIADEFMAEEIYKKLYYHVRNILKREFYLEKFLGEVSNE